MVYNNNINLHMSRKKTDISDFNYYGNIINYTSVLLSMYVHFYK